jgi:hypothetical protein
MPMRRDTHPSGGNFVNQRSWICAVVAASAGLSGVAVSSAAAGVARADTLAHLVNVTVRPGYNFVNADDAVAYGQGICGRIAQRLTYADVIAGVKADFANPDEYQASYLVAQAVNELCPSLIWQLRTQLPAITRRQPDRADR